MSMTNLYCCTTNIGKLKNAVAEVKGENNKKAQKAKEKTGQE